MTIKQISVFVSNMTGGLADVAEDIGKGGVDIRALSIADTTDFGILRLIVDNPDRALETLRADGYVVSVTDVVAAHIDDTPGGLARVLRILADAGIGIEYVYAFVTRQAKNAYVVFRLDDGERGCRILEENGVRLASPDEVYKL